MLIGLVQVAGDDMEELGRDMEREGPCSSGRYSWGVGFVAAEHLDSKCLGGGGPVGVAEPRTAVQIIRNLIHSRGRRTS